ncbi:MAG: Ig-like domain-containing protein [Desulfobacterales bacterium]|nr:Ig-like domain-containing protein [Desulfobacterales bacterium]
MKYNHIRMALLFILIIFSAFSIGCGSSGSADSSSSGEFVESISESNPETASIVINAEPTSLAADGSSSSAITAVLKDNTGQPVLKGTSVTFTTTLGRFPNGSTTWTTSTSNDSGSLTVSLIAGLTPGTASISCEANNVTQLINIELTGDGLTVSAIDLRPSSTTVSADGFSQIQIVASAKTADNQAVSGAEVTFKCTRGTISSPHETDNNGRAIAQLTSDRCNDNSVIVTAECQGVTKDTVIVFAGVGVDLEADRTNLLAGENNFSTITATLKDAAGNPISNADILISSNMGEIELIDSLIPITDLNGKVKFCLYSIDPGNVTVNVSGNGSKKSIDINFTQYLFTLETSLNPIRVNQSTGVIAKIENAGTGSVEGETISFSSSLGTINPFKKQIDHGEAWTTLTAGSHAGVATIDADITINSDSPPTVLSASTQVNIIGWDANKIVLTADPNIIAVGTGESTITAKLFDANDQPVGDSSVYFRIALGPGGGEYLSDSIVTTNNAGVATIKLHAGTLSSILRGVKVEASIGPDFPDNPFAPSATFLTIAGPVSKIGVGINLHTVEPEGGHLYVDVSALVTDSNGNPVADGSLVNFSVDAIGFDEDRDDDGVLHIWDSDGNRFGEDKYKIDFMEDCVSIYSKSEPYELSASYSYNYLGIDWYTDDVNLDGKLTDGQDFTKSEDRNGNGLLDTGEDVNGNGIIDPVNSCVIGKSIPTINGVAATTLTYLQPHAANIKVRITAESGGISNFYESILLCTVKMVENGTCGRAY